jgi:predicted amidohydrolase YtcJ
MSRAEVDVTPDLVVANGVVETMDAEARTVGAFAVARGRVVALGSAEEILALAGSATEVLDLHGTTVLPGFMDTHLHLEKVAREMAMMQLSAATTLADVLGAVRAMASSVPRGAWIRSFGDDNSWHEDQLAEGRLPTRSEIEDVAGNANPVFLYRGPDAAAMNGAAITALAEPLSAIDRSDFDPDRGWLHGPVARELERTLPRGPREVELRQLADASRQLLSYGLTTIADPGLPAQFTRSWELYRDLGSRGELRQRVVLMNRLDPARSVESEFERVLGSEVLPGDGDEHLTAGAVKVLLDGEFANAWMRTGEHCSGTALRRYTEVELDSIVSLCAEHRWPLCVHAMGGGAIAAVIASVDRARGRGSRFKVDQVSIAHAFLIADRDLAECSRLGIALSVHPMLAYCFETEMTEAWGDLAESANPIASMLRRGVTTAGGSDTLPNEPLRGGRYAVDRTARRGTVLGAEEAVTPAQALVL